MAPMSRQRLARFRLAAQRLTPETAAANAAAAAGAVLGIQAQDLRAASLALRSRVPGLERDAINSDSELVRTWTARGTVHLLAADDLPWIHALTGPRNQRRYEVLLAKRGNLELARSVLPAAIEILAAEGPLSRAALLVRLSECGHPDLGPYSVNVFVPWIAAQGLILGLADGRFRAAEPPAAVEPDEALSILGRRYLEGYGPAGARDLARWSGLPLGTARRCLDATGDLEPAGDDLLALPGTLAADPPPPPSALLLASFDTSMLGWRSREPLLATADDSRILPGGGILKPVVLARGAATGTWKVKGSGKHRKVEIEWFGRPAAAQALEAEVKDVARFLGLELQLAA